MSENEKPKLKPLFIVKPKTMSRADIRRAEKFAGIVIVECADPESARFLHPPPDAGLDVQALAALSLMRLVLRGEGNVTFNRHDLMKWFIDRLMDMTAPEPVKSVKGK